MLSQAQNELLIFNHRQDESYSYSRCGEQTETSLYFILINNSPHEYNIKKTHFYEIPVKNHR